MTTVVAKIWVTLALAVAAFAFPACEKPDPGAAANALFKQSDTIDNLKALVEEILKAQESGDLERAAALTNNLVFDDALLVKIFKADAPKAFLTKQKLQLKRYPSIQSELANLIQRKKPARTQVNIHGATTEEIQAAVGGDAAATEAAKEFLLMPKDFADNLRPGMKFYELELVEPGKSGGTKYHMFFWDGSRWRMLGPAWR
jgi:hypothetical protein